MGIRVMLDSDDPAVLIASKADYVATYADLLTPALHIQLTSAGRQLLVIDRGSGDPLGLATALDAGEGKVPITEAPAWWDMQTKAGRKGLTIYHNRNQAEQVWQEMGKRSFFTWLGTLDGTAFYQGWQPGRGPAIIQILGEAQLGYHADLSLIFSDYFLPEPSVAGLRAAIEREQADAAVALAALEKYAAAVS